MKTCPQEKQKEFIWFACAIYFIGGSCFKTEKPFSKGFWCFFLESINTKKWLEFQKKHLNSKKNEIKKKSKI